MEIQLWREILEPYALAVDELVIKFTHIKNSLRKQDDYCPIELVTGRVKTIASIVEKCNRKKIPLEHLEEEMTDIAGVRLICQFVEDCYVVADMIKKRSDILVVSEADYIAQPKDSGYRSYHMKIRYTVETVNGPKTLNAEIQIRTLGMNCWSTPSTPSSFNVATISSAGMGGPLRPFVAPVSQYTRYSGICALSALQISLPKAMKSTFLGVALDCLASISFIYGTMSVSLPLTSM